MKRGTMTALAIGLAVVCGAASAHGATATGGTVTIEDGYQIHTFTNGGTFQVSDGSLTCDALVVAGGGGSSSDKAGGGGGGGVVYTSGVPFAAGSYVVTVGAGGAGSANSISRGGNGANSSISNSGLLIETI
ncbi:MAG: hypothetical protein PHR35_08255, partial [Kiritimatiellae bacterium]|nr:hypothetical protein [Kiritimatiellia bacterium]